jgi:hypothetical protein
MNIKYYTLNNFIFTNIYLFFKIKKNIVFIYIPKIKKVMKLDIKSILIILLSIFCIFFFSIWYLKGTDNKKEYKILEDKFEKIQQARDSLIKVNLKLSSDFDKKQKDINERDEKISNIESDLVNIKIDLKEAESELVRNKKDLEETKRKIEKLKKNPIKREDDNLIKSLREKLK